MALSQFTLLRKLSNLPAILKKRKGAEIRGFPAVDKLI